MVVLVFSLWIDFIICFSLPQNFHGLNMEIIQNQRKKKVWNEVTMLVTEKLTEIAEPSRVQVLR